MAGAMLREVLIFLAGFVTAAIIVALFVVLSFLGGTDLPQPEDWVRQQSRHGGAEE
jgi:hypothetical protein